MILTATIKSNQIFFYLINKRLFMSFNTDQNSHIRNNALNIMMILLFTVPIVYLHDKPKLVGREGNEKEGAEAPALTGVAVSHERAAPRASCALDQRYLSPETDT